jgi:Protein of unknown function (DUF3040)
MSLSRRQQRLLNQIDEAVSRSDPRLAGMLAVFTRLTAGEPMPCREQLRTLVGWIRAALVLAATAITTLIIVAAGTMARATGPTAGAADQMPPPPQVPSALTP